LLHKAAVVELHRQDRKQELRWHVEVHALALFLESKKELLEVAYAASNY
jgi:hypothetical protein